MLNPIKRRWGVSLTSSSSGWSFSMALIIAQLDPEITVWTYKTWPLARIVRSEYS